MTNLAGIAATFSDLKLIRGRKVAQLIFEIPVENAKQAIDALGMPALETWCAIARLNQKPGQQPALGADPVGAGGDDTAKPIVRQADAPPKPNSTRAVMMAKDPEFWAYASTRMGMVIDSPDLGDAAVKDLCDVSSKTALNEGPGSVAFDRLRSDFYAWRRGQ